MNQNQIKERIIGLIGILHHAMTNNGMSKIDIDETAEWLFEEIYSDVLETIRKASPEKLSKVAIRRIHHRFSKLSDLEQDALLKKLMKDHGVVKSKSKGSRGPKTAVYYIPKHDDLA